MIKKIHIAPAAFLLLALSGYAEWYRDAGKKDTDLSIHRKSLRLEEVTTIGEKTAPQAAWLGRPAAVATDDVHNLIYVADRDRMQIRVFDRNGTYLWHIGRRGRERGELRSILGMNLNGDGELVVGDLLNNRITTYTRDGKVTLERSVAGKEILWPKHFHILGSQTIFLTRLPRTIKGERPEGVNHLFHVYDHSLTQTTTFGEVDELAPEPDYVHQLFAQGDPGFFWPIEGSHPAIIYAPALYLGNLYRFDLLDGVWRLTQKLTGFIGDQSGMTVTHRVPGRPLPKDTGMKLTTHGVSVAITFHSLSLGVFSDSQNRIVHFSMMQFRGQRKLVVQQFGPDGHMLAYDIVESTATWAGMLDCEVMWKDRSDLYYIVEFTPDPVVKSVRLHWGAALLPEERNSAGSR